MKNPRLIYPLLVAVAGMGVGNAATVANWKQFNPNRTIPITGADTDSPTFGDGTADSSQQAWIAGRFGTTAQPASVTLSVGQTLTISGNLTLTGGTNNNNQFRFGAFDDGGQFAAGSGDVWNGGWLHSIGTAASSDLYQGRTNGAFISTSGNASALNATVTRSGTFDGDSTSPFLFNVSVTRDSATTVDVATLITGGDGAYNEFYVADDITTDLFTYTALGLLFGGSSGVDQAGFSGVSYTVIPEPAATSLGLLGLLALALRRQRRC